MTNKALKSLKYLLTREKMDIPEHEKEQTRMRIAGMIEWIENIDDPLVKDIVRYRYLRGFSWVKIAHKVGGGNTQDSVRMIVNRYLNKK